MPRKPKEKKGEVGRNPGSVQAEAKLSSHPVVGAARLLTLGPEHPVWEAPAEATLDIGPTDLVRVISPADASEELVRSVVERVRSMCAAVKPVPARRSSATVNSPALERGARRSAREAVLAKVEIANVDNRALLEKVVEDIMARVGLS